PSAGDDPRILTNAGERVRHRPALRDQRIAGGARHAVQLRAACRRFTRASRAEAPWDAHSLERAVGGAEVNRIARRDDERGKRGELVGADDGDIVPVDDARRRLQYVDRVLEELTSAR